MIYNLFQLKTAISNTEKFFNKHEYTIMESLLTDLAKKVYINGQPHFGITQIPILGINVPVKQLQEMKECVLLSGQDGPNMTRDNWKCGEVSLLNLSNIRDNLESNEELSIIINGEREWGKSMRPAGWFSNSILNRNYGRDEVSKNNIPHAILVGVNTYPGNFVPDSQIPIFPASHDGVQGAKSHIKKVLITRHMKWFTDKVSSENISSGYKHGHEDGFNDGYNQGYNRGYNNGLMEGRHQSPHLTTLVVEKTVPVNRIDPKSIKNLDECQNNLRQALEAVDNLNKTKNNEFQRGFKQGEAQGVDAGYAKRMGEES